MLHVVENTYIPRGQQSPPWTTEELKIVHSDNELAVLANSSVEGIVAEFPFYGHEPFVVTSLNSQPTQTAVLRVSAKYKHPHLGSGCLMVLTLPIDSTDPKLANDLNLAESRELSGCHLTGAWCVGLQGIAFATFIPSAAYKAGLLSLLYQRSALRTQWAKEYLDNL
jgi:hypothetical protein